MKLSHIHDSNGLAGYIRSVATGETLHFNFQPGRLRVPVQVVMGDRHLEAQLRIEVVPTEAPYDDLDVELSLRVPDVATTSDVDYKPKLTPPKEPAVLDQDGSFMATVTDDAYQIQDAVPVEKRELVFGPGEREAFGPMDAASEPARDAPEDLFEGETQVEAGASEGVAERPEHPALKVPELPGVGADRKKKGRR